MSKLNLSNDTFTFDKLAEKYRDFQAPTFQVIVEGKNLDKEHIAISTVKVESSIEAKADSFSFTVINAFDFSARDFQWIDKYFLPAKSVEIKMGYTDKLETVIDGVITSVSFDYPKGGNPVISVKGMDVSFLMMRGKNSVTWTEKKYSDIVKEIGNRYVSNLDIDDTTNKKNVISQNGMEDFHFINKLAKEVNYDFFIIGSTLYFKKPLSGTNPVVTLEWGKHLHSFTTDVNLSSQVSKVVLRSVDTLNKDIITATASSVNKLGSNSKTGVDMMKMLGKNTVEYIQENVSSKKEAQDRADAALNHKAMEFITGSGECIGIPEVQAGRYIKLEHLGKKLSQPYYLKAVTHTINKSGYMTSFNVGGNAI